MSVYEQLGRCTGFMWDEGNRDKNWRKHAVSPSECEQLFFNQPLLIATDEPHSTKEPRYFALGQTDTGRELFLVFTLRGEAIRVISARDMSRKERSIYHAPKTT